MLDTMERGAPTQHCFLRTCQSPPKALRAKLGPTFLPPVLVRASQLLSLLLQLLEVAHSKARSSASNKLSDDGCTVTSPGELLKTLVPSPKNLRKWSGERQLTSILNKLPSTQPGLKSSQS